LHTWWYSDTLDVTIKSTRENKYRQLFCNDEHWAIIVPMQSKANCGDAFNRVVHKYGIPEFGIHTDNAGKESGTHTEWEKTRKHFLINQTFIEPHSPWMNRAKGEIGCTKTHFH